MTTLRSVVEDIQTQLARVDKHNNQVESGPQAEGGVDEEVDVAKAKESSDRRKRDGWKKVPKRTGRDRAGS